MNNNKENVYWNFKKIKKKWYKLSNTFIVAGRSAVAPHNKHLHSLLPMASHDKAQLELQIAELHAQVGRLEALLEVEKKKNVRNVVRQKIDVMSSEVVDSNPYR